MIIIEADSEAVIQFINDPQTYPPANKRPLLAEIRFLSAEKNMIFRYASRECKQIGW